MSDFEIRGSGSSWAIYRDAQRVSGFYSSHTQCTAGLRTFERKARERPRTCLCCGTTFASEGAHNRLCNSCRTRDLGLAV